MTQAQTLGLQARERLSFLKFITDAFPRGLKLALLGLGIMQIFISILLVWILSNQAAADRVRDHRIQIIDRMATKDSITAVQVQALTEVNAKQVEMLNQVILHQSQAETRGAWNHGALDTIKQAVKPLLRASIKTLPLK